MTPPRAAAALKPCPFCGGAAEHEVISKTHFVGCGTQAFVIAGDERPIGRYDYEGGAYVRIAASGDIDTEEALDMVETLIQLKRAELKRKAKASNSSASDAIAKPENIEDPLE